MSGPAPLLRIERGNPAPHELAAVTAVLLAAFAAPATAGREQRPVRRRTAAATVHRPTPRSWRAGP